MRTLLMVTALMLTSCAQPQHSDTQRTPTALKWPMVQLDSPPDPNRYGSDNDKRTALGNYAADTSLYAYYVFHHARATNHLALEAGWLPPLFAPLCEGFTLPAVDPLPDKVMLRIDSDTPRKMALDVANQYRALLRQYREERTAINTAYEKHRATCLF